MAAMDNPAEPSMATLANFPVNGPAEPVVEGPFIDGMTGPLANLKRGCFRTYSMHPQHGYSRVCFGRGFGCHCHEQLLL